MRGTRLKCLTSFAASRVISASSSAVGLKLTVVSAKNKRSFFSEHQIHARNFFHTVFRSDNFDGRADRVRIVFSKAGDHGICFTGFDHHTSEIISVDA